ncbi:3-methyl-2-oxobutanoate dehydrogenase subunit alpha [archaeon HR01]|nr:3-methyl-2-oxobutanoate dehydrogenase subunit alpha [archaeon HR01]
MRRFSPYSRPIDSDKAFISMVQSYKQVSMFQALSPDGEELTEFKLSHDLLLSMYRDMVMARVLDKWLFNLQRMGKIGIHAPSEGQEASYVGTAYSLAENDWVFPLYRELPVYIARRVPIDDIINRHLSNSRDPLKGHDFAIYGDRRYRIVPAAIPVSVHIAPAVGFALAIKILGEKDVVMSFFGDGATSKGDFHESLNFAGVFKAPVVFVCVNNQYAISMPVYRQTAAKTLADKAVAYGFPGVRVDGNDVIACYLVGRNAVERAREGHGPTLIEAVTYRLGPHTTADDPRRYRPVEEEQGWRMRDPIKRLKKHLIRRGVWSEKEDEDLWVGCENTVKEAIERCERNPPLPPSAIFDDVYASETWIQMEEREEFIRLL